jgi:hypothetical protein
VEAGVQALFKAAHNDPPEKIRPCDLLKLIPSLKLRKASGIDGIPNECLRHLPRRPLVHLTNLINHMHSALILSDALERSKSDRLLRTLNSLKIYVRSASCPQRANF